MTGLGPSRHLDWHELACRDLAHTTYPLDWRTDPSRLPALCRAFEDVRAECSTEAGTDCPLTVLEAYRTQEYQAQLRKNPVYKAAKNSQHCQGRALDVACPRLLTFAQFEACVKRAAAVPNSPIRYIELRPSMRYVHFDVRPTAKLVIETID